VSLDVFFTGIFHDVRGSVTLSYRRCPKCGHEARPGEPPLSDACPACGVIFEKFLKARLDRRDGAAARANAGRDAGGRSFTTQARSILLHVPDDVPRHHVYARLGLFLVLVAYGLHLAAMDVPTWEMGGSLIHLPMVPLHEFGHIFFTPFGEFMMHFGGALFQAGLPLVLGGLFLVRNRDPFAAAVMLWWSAVAVMDTAPYVYDAQQPVHILLTGRTGDDGAHDFIDVLGDLGLLSRGQAVGYTVHHFGVAMLVVSLLWGAWVIARQYRARV
jgi:hypothetical protein